MSNNQRQRFDDVIEQLKEYDFESVFLWLQVVSSHPSNQKYCGRIDLLNALLLSVRSSEFRGKEFGRDDCESVFRYLSDNYGPYFGPVEDFEPFEQVKLIPHFYKGAKYYFYYGGYESPVEELENFQNLYLSGSARGSIPELSTIEACFRVSLTFQSALLERVTGMDESQKTSDIVYVPSDEYFGNVGGLFEISEGDRSLLENMTALRAGDFNQRQAQLGDMILDYNLFQSYKIETPAGRTVYLTPARHIDVLYSFAFQLVERSQVRDDIKKSVDENCRREVQKTCWRFFTVRGTLTGLYGMGSNENLVEKVDFAGVTDGGKILLFKVLPSCALGELDGKLNASKIEVQSVVDAMKAGDFIGLRYATEPEEVPAVPTAAVEMFTIYVIPRLTLEPCVVTRKKEMGDKNSLVLVLTDMQRIFERIDSPLAFVKFLRDDNELRKKGRIFCTDYLDRFIYYVENQNSYFTEGRAYTGVFFQPHSWSNIYAEKLYIERNDSLYELVERHFPRCFNKIEKKGQLYTLTDTATLTGAYAMIFNGGLVIVSLPPDAYFCTREEVKFSEFLSNFYAYYLKKLEPSLKEFLEDHEIELDDLYMISTMPVSYIKRHKMKYLDALVARVSEKNPIEIMTGRTKGMNDLRTTVVFDLDALPSVFSKKDNQGERRAFGELLVSLLEYMKPETRWADLKSDTKAFVDKIIPVGPRAFSMDAVPIDNPKVEKYREHDEPSGSDVGRVERITAEHIANSGTEPGTYKRAQAVQILESSFDFVCEKLEKELKVFNQSIVHGAFEQLEFIEYKRIALGIRAGADSCKYVEYDVEQRFTEDYSKISRAAVAVKYLCTNVIKLGACGSKAVDRESWDRLLALAYSAVDLSYLIDLVRYDLRQHTIKINEMYKITHEVQSDSFDMHGFAQGEARHKISQMADQVSREGKDNDPRPDENMERRFLKKLDQAFEIEHGFKFTDMVVVLFAFGKYDGKRSLPSIVNDCSKEDLIAFLQYEIAVNQPTREALGSIIDFVSLDKLSFREGKIIPTQVFRDRKRINLCPVYRSDKRYIFGNQMCIEASKFWMSAVVAGDFPYSLDKGSQIEQCMVDYRAKLDKELEEEAEKVIRAKLGGENYEANIMNFTRLHDDFPRRPECGEIDLLAVNRGSKTLFLLDAKNRKRSITPYGIRTDIETFLKGKKSYLGHMVKKEKFIKSNFGQVLEHFSIDCADGWKLKKAFVVNHNYQVAYYYKKAIDFVELRDLAAYLDS